MRIEVIHDPDCFAAAEEAWNKSIVGICGQAHPFLSHFWFSAYYRAFLHDSPLFVVTARDDSGRFLGILPMAIGRRRLGGIPLKEARLIAGDHSHINGIPIPADDPGLGGTLLDRVRDEGVDLIYLEDPAEMFFDRGRWESFCRSRNLPLEIRQVRSSPYIVTTGSFDDYRRTLSKKFRELLNNRLNRINRAGGFEIRIFGNNADTDAVLSDMREISTRSWQGQEGSGLFSTPETDAFYRSLVAHAMKNGYGRVCILYFGGKPAAFEFHVLHETTEYCLKAEYSREFEQVSPGAVLDMELVKRAFESEIERYDLLGYADRYKLRWTKRTQPYYRYFIFNRTAAGMAAHALYFRLGNRLRNMSILRRIKEMVRKS